MPLTVESGLNLSEIKLMATDLGYARNEFVLTGDGHEYKLTITTSVYETGNQMASWFQAMVGSEPTATGWVSYTFTNYRGGVTGTYNDYLGSEAKVYDLGNQHAESVFFLATVQDYLHAMKYAGQGEASLAGIMAYTTALIG